MYIQYTICIYQKLVLGSGIWMSQHVLVVDVQMVDVLDEFV